MQHARQVDTRIRVRIRIAFSVLGGDYGMDLANDHDHQGFQKQVITVSLGMAATPPRLIDFTEWHGPPFVERARCGHADRGCCARVMS